MPYHQKSVGWRLFYVFSNIRDIDLVTLEFKLPRSHGMLVKESAQTCWKQTDVGQKIRLGLCTHATTSPLWMKNTLWNLSITLHGVTATWWLTSDTTEEHTQSEFKTRNCCRRCTRFIIVLEYCQSWKFKQYCYVLYFYWAYLSEAAYYSDYNAIIEQLTN